MPRTSSFDQDKETRVFVFLACGVELLEVEQCSALRMWSCIHCWEIPVLAANQSQVRNAQQKGSFEHVVH